MQLSANADNTFVWGTATSAVSIDTADAFLIFPNATGATGRVGIGTSTPSARLTVAGTAGNVAFECSSNETTATNNILMLRSDVNSNENPVFRVQADGATYATGAYIGGGSDYAEWFACEGDVEAGDVIGLNLASGKVRKYQSGDAIVGIYSQHPVVVGGQPKGMTEDEMRKDHVLVALVGQVDVDGGQVTIKDGKVFTTDGFKLGYWLASGKVLIGRGAMTVNEELKTENDTLRARLSALEEKMDIIQCSNRIR